ncbi:C40 family peptidase [Streptacidiphilus rugosus]|uniref:C40 family peptidase n=1 Tax=Streptacidiphilus rugosus TaxID=405783 RepID=UPI00056C47DD|nr:C40 family peptidase [Streptacidiphilus rugosus]
MNRRTASLVAGLAALLLPGALALPQAVASARADTPPGPSSGAVHSAQAAAEAAQARVNAVAAQLAAAQATEQALNMRAEAAVEAYNGAVVAQQRADSAAATARVAAAAADQANASALEQVGRLAVQEYQDGGPPQLDGFVGLLAAQTPADAALATQAARAAAERASSILHAAAATASAAARTSAAAQAASTAAAAATAKVQAARIQAQQLLADQQAQVTALDTQRTQLLAGLADAQRTALQLTEARAAALAAQAARLAALQKQQSAGVAPVPVPVSGNVSDVIAFARAQLGLPYVWGGAGPATYDCSGLTMRAWQRAGISLPHFAADQYAESHPVTYRQLQPGDLVFWSHDGTPQGIYHVALYIGSDTIIEAPRTGDVVKTASLWIMGTPAYYARP